MKLKKLSYITVLFILGLVGTSFHHPATPFNDGKIRTIVIDAGHGGKDPGAIGSKSKEKNITLAIALELRRIINDNMPDMKVIMTRDNDSFIELHNRAQEVAKTEADFFVSIHCNANRNKAASGSETYVLGAHKANANLDVVMRENGVILLEDNYKEVYEGFDPNSIPAYIFFQYLTNIHLEQSWKMATKVQKQFAERVGRTDRGVKQAGYLVLWRASKPSILIETGFISNKEEEAFLTSENGQTYLASAIYRAIKEYNAEMMGQETEASAH
ncbi:MAG TPA: N-acetylmuramoyl-L-alanine amidase [Bacteroidetes bacterium]|nr:N-acetylmuramoyl-L-alanine amidase [Bacteroidota bacterium]